MKCLLPSRIPTLTWMLLFETLPVKNSLTEDEVDHTGHSKGFSPIDPSQAMKTKDETLGTLQF